MYLLDLIMDFLNIHQQAEDQKLKAGRLLVAEPFLNDPNFARSVIFLCEAGDEGSIGFVLNKPTDYKLGDLLPEFNTPGLEINQGGPVQLDTLHMLHRMPGLLGGNEIFPGIYWGGSYEALQEILADEKYQEEDLKLFLGYSGWSPGQLEKEVKDGAWLITDLSEDLLFATESRQIWKNAIHLLGKEFEILANMPVNPQLN